ncbi:hypothetical protein [Rubidibacter lacunae]|uniref:hypothetical protein n=1 Tax=Rubidibacter lacunae TaxID=582514 RepID=UPI0004083E18|nr:hypothetical protein [Rubidibacter lacunae]
MRLNAVTTFQYDRKTYSCAVKQQDLHLELRVQNFKTKYILAVRQGETLGLLGRDRATARPIDISQPYFFNLIKAALGALKIAELEAEARKTDALFAELSKAVECQAEQIELLETQLQLLETEKDKLSASAQQRLGGLRSESAASDRRTRSERELVAKLQAELAAEKQKAIALETELDRAIPRVNRQEFWQQVEGELGEDTWANLDRAVRGPLFEKLLESEQQAAVIESLNCVGADIFAGSTPAADYSTAGLPLCEIVERAIVNDFFTELYRFLCDRYPERRTPSGHCELGGLKIRAAHQSGTRSAPWGNLAQLLAPNWHCLRRDALDADRPPARDVYVTARARELTERDRQIVRDCLDAWDSPIARWMQRSTLAASALDQIRQLRNRIAHPGPLHIWQYRHLRASIIGDASRRGILAQIYSASTARTLP